MRSDGASETELLRIAVDTPFRIVATDVREGVDASMLFTHVELRIGDDDDGDEGESEDDVEWAAFGFLFALAALSFHDARPRGVSDRDFVDDDEFTAADLLAGLRFERGALQFSVDYLRGRCVKTDVAIRADGHVTIDTRNRGDAVLRWLDRIQGKKLISVVPGGDAGAEPAP